MKHSTHASLSFLTPHGTERRIEMYPAPAWRKNCPGHRNQMHPLRRLDKRVGADGVHQTTPTPTFGGISQTSESQTGAAFHALADLAGR